MCKESANVSANPDNSKSESMTDATSETEAMQTSTTEATTSKCSKLTKTETSAKNRAKAIRLARTKVDLLKLQVELAAARIARMELEDDSDTDSAVSGEDSTHRCSKWVNDTRQRTGTEDKNTPVDSVPLIVNGSTPRKFQEIEKEVPLKKDKVTTVSCSTQVDQPDPTTATVLTALKDVFGCLVCYVIAESYALRERTCVSDAAEDVCIFACNVNNLIAALRTVNHRVEERDYNFYHLNLIRTTIMKLPPKLKYEWYTYAANQQQSEPELEKLSRFMCEKLKLYGSRVETENVFKKQRTTIRQPPSWLPQSVYVSGSIKKIAQCGRCSYIVYNVKKKM